MTVARLAISFDEDLARQVKRAVGKGSTSAWLAEAARQRLQSEGLLAVVRDWEKEHGAFTEAELARAGTDLDELERRVRRARAKKKRSR